MSAGFNVEDWGPVHAVPTYHKAGAGERTAPFGTAERPLPLIIDSDPGPRRRAGHRPRLREPGAPAARGDDGRAATPTSRAAPRTRSGSSTPTAATTCRWPRGPRARCWAPSSARRRSTARAASATRALPPAPNAPRPEGAVALMARLHRGQPRAGGHRADRAAHQHRAAAAAVPAARVAKIAHVCLMGGSIGEGNTTASAEFNIVADPEAADVVFRSGVPITMIGLDVTHQALLDRAAAQALRDLGHALRADRRRADRLRAGPQPRVVRLHDHGDPRRRGRRAPAGPGPRRRGARTTWRWTRRHGPARGRTVCDGLPYRLRRDGREPNADVGIVIDRDRFERLLLDAFARLP